MTWINARLRGREGRYLHTRIGRQKNKSGKKFTNMRMNAKPKAKLMIAVCKTGSILGSLFAKVSGELVGSQHSHKLRI